MDPRTASGHRSYVQAHAMAAVRLGFSPQLFFVARSGTVTECEYGVVRLVPERFHHHNVAVVRNRSLASAVADYLGGCGPGPHIVHSFGPWCGAGATACRMLRARGIDARPIGSAYTTLTHEWHALVAGLPHERHISALRYIGWYPWVRTAGVRTERAGYRHSRPLLVNYESVRTLLEAECGPGLALRRLPYAAPAAFREPDTAAGKPTPPALATLMPADAPLIVSVSRHDPRKGLDVLLRALARLTQRGVGYRACLVGGGRLLNAHRKQVESLGLTAHVAVPGRVDDVFDYLRRADVFVLPSREEGSGSVSLLEALQAGVPVVASRCDGMPEDIRDGEDGLLVTPGDARGLADALERLIGSPSERAGFAASSRRLYAERFSAAGFTAALGEAYAASGVPLPQGSR
jgi:glycosyltransferase involved in cell wall biosynthesis